MRLSAAVQTAWQFGAAETIRGRHQFIEKEQVLIGIFSLEKAVAVEDSTELDPFAAKSLLVENNKIEGLLRECGLDQTSIRHALRIRTGKADFIHSEKIVHRSEACREYFRDAEKIAKERGSDELCCRDILAAVMKKPGPHIVGVLKGFNVKTEDVEKAIFAQKKKQDHNSETSSYKLNQSNPDGGSV